MSPEYKAVWDEFKARVGEHVDDLTWSEWDDVVPAGWPINFVQVSAVIKGHPRTWTERFSDSEPFTAVDLLSAWLAEIEWQILRIAAGEPLIAYIGGHCPVQGYEIRDGWLFYFRARGGWSLCAWPPGTWTSDGSTDECPQAALDRMYSESEPPVELDESDEDETFPKPHDSESDYPGWWSYGYATRVAEWAIARAMSAHAKKPADA